MKILPGWISATIHRSLDGTKVVNYVQWENHTAFERLLSSPELRPYIQACEHIAEQVEPHLYEVVYSKEVGS